MNFFLPTWKAGLATIAFLFLLGSCKSKDKQPASTNTGPRRDVPLQVEAFVAKTKDLAEVLEVPGTLQAFEETEIRPEISGRIVRLNITEGGSVAKGALLAKLFDEDLQAQLNKLQVQLEIAQKTLERQRELLKIQGVSQQEVDLSELQVNNIKADIELVRVSISKTEIRAPYAGRLGLRNVSLGAYVSPSIVLTTLRQTNQLKLDFTVPEKYSELFQKGHVVNFLIAGSKQVFTASILATEAAVEAETRTLKVRATVSANNSALLPGIFAKVQLNISSKGKSLVVPTRSVIPQARNKQVIVYKNGSPDFRVVETGIRDATYIQISDGLQAGDTVLTTGLLAIRPGSKLVLTRVE